MSDETSYPIDPLFVQAAATLAKQLGVNPGDVQIGRNPTAATKRMAELVATAPIDTTPTLNTPVDLYVIVHKPGVDVNETDTTQAIRKALSEMPTITAVAQMTPPEQLALKLAQQLRAAAANTTFDAGLLDWPGFDPNIAKNHGTGDHAIQNIDTNAYGIKFDIRIPARKDTDISVFTKSITDGITARAAEIKDILASRTEKYIKENMTLAGKSAAEITAAQAQAREIIAGLIITTNTNAESGRVEVTLRSQKQDQALKASKTGRDWPEPDNADELRASNPLYSLTSKVIPATDTKPERQPQLHRALGRAFFFDKNKKNIPGFVQIAGNSDIRTAIAKEMIRVLPQHPEKKEAFDAILNSDLFKNHHSWNGAQNAGDALPEPVFERLEGKNDVMQIKLTLTRKPNEPDPVKAFLDGLIAGSPQPAQEETAPDAPSIAGKIVAAGPSSQSWAEKATDILKAQREGGGKGAGVSAA